MLLYTLLCVEIAARIAIEIRERRLTQLRGGVFAVLRLIPLVNDFVPLPENLMEVVLFELKSCFVFHVEDEELL